MTTEQLNKLESLQEIWLHSDGPKADCAAYDVMDLLPDALEHIKRLTAERDAALEQLRIAENQALAATEMMDHAVELKCAAQKAFAEMREALELARRHFIRHNASNLDQLAAMPTPFDKALTVTGKLMEEK